MELRVFLPFLPALRGFHAAASAPFPPAEGGFTESVFWHQILISNVSNVGTTTFIVNFFYLLRTNSTTHVHEHVHFEN